ncbi:hypothetical protein HAX54_039290, partial [Datura stramonium]|nr:hypothetical protein [Datura stramonium]
KLDMLGFCVSHDLFLPCNVGIDSSAWHVMLGIWSWCLACAVGAFIRTTREWCSACAVRLDPCLRSDVLTRMPSQSWGRRKLGLHKICFLCFLPNTQALLCTIGFLSPLAHLVRAEPKAALVSHVFLASSCDIV